ncbi:MAG: amidophosphoribosyltransferase [Phycisphaerae bacterium]|nr:amidophosphoribosyltransferase [Phycisphaerae bacterium]
MSCTPEIRHNCGLFGIVNHPHAAAMVYLGLFAQQHRGQEAAGICACDGREIVRRIGKGLVREAFDEETLAALPGGSAIGHTRYSTTGASIESNIQPFLVSGALGQVAICHNGNLCNAGGLRREYESRGTIFHTTSDTEVVLHMMADRRYAEQPDPLAAVLRNVRGSFCLLILHPDRLEAARDAQGNRPLCIGRKDGAWMICSETCALDMVQAEFVREVEPGEIVTLTAAGVQSRRFANPDPAHHAHCVFEHVYFADPASDIFGDNVHDVRRKMGQQLAREAPVEADLVVAVPNAARCAALGYHEESGIPIGRGFTTNHYIGRSFIQPSQTSRESTVRMKLNVIRSRVQGKRLVVIEDSVVRGTTTRGKMEALRSAGVKEIHLRVASPPIRHPCYYGIDFPRREDLIANGNEIETIRRMLEVDSLAYLSLEGMLRCVGRPQERYCTACFSGRYPIPVEDGFEKGMFDDRQLTFFEPGDALTRAMRP